MKTIYNHNLVTISGPQGCGKSTTMEALKVLVKEQGLPITVDDFKVSRAVQTARGGVLTDATKDFPTMLEFQRAISRARTRYEDDVLPDTMSKIVVMERGFADIAAYFRLWVEKLQPEEFYRPMIDDFVNDCRTQAKFTQMSLYLPFMDHVKFEADANRAAESDVSRFNELLLDELSQPVYANAQATIEGKTPEQRAQSIIDSIKHLL